MANLPKAIDSGLIPPDDGTGTVTARWDGTLTERESFIDKGNHPQMAELFRLVNYHNLPRSLFFHIYNHIYIYILIYIYIIYIYILW